MNYFQKMFGCCERDKSFKKSDLCLNNSKNENESNLPYYMLTNNYKMNHSSVSNASQTVTLSISSKNNVLDFNPTKNEELDKSRAKFLPNLQ